MTRSGSSRSSSWSGLLTAAGDLLHAVAETPVLATDFHETTYETDVKLLYDYRSTVYEAFHRHFHWTACHHLKHGITW